MCANQNNNSNDTQAPGPQRTLTLNDICLDLQLKAKDFMKDFTLFLEKNRIFLGLEDVEDITAAYIEKIWPDNLPGSMVVAASSFDQFDRWIIRPPVDGPMATTFAANGLVPTFSAYRRQGAIVIDGFTTTAHVPLRPFERYISGTIHINSETPSMTQAEFAELSQLPDQRQQMNMRLNTWRECLDWRKKLVLIGQVALRYDSYEIGQDGDITFLVRNNGAIGRVAHYKSTVMLATSINYSLSPSLWTPMPNIRPNFNKIGKVAKVWHSETTRDTLENQNADANNHGNQHVFFVTIQTESDGNTPSEEDIDIPKEGFLLSAIGGDMKPINSERRAIDRLCKGQSHNWYLADFMFDIGNAAVPAEISDVFAHSQPFADLNDGQRESVNKALAVSDITLVQGPPGTGKTTVIVEICYQEAKRGHRVLVVSQANVAVDNVLSRLSKDSAIRPLRIGKRQRIDMEGQAFLLENALGAWLQVVVHTCRQRIHKVRSNEQRIQKAQEAFARLENVLSRSQEISRQVKKLIDHRNEITELRNDRCSLRKKLSDRINNYKRKQTVLTEISQFEDNPDLNISSVKLLSDMKINETADTAVKNLAKALSPNSIGIPYLRNSDQKDSNTSFTTLSLVLNAIRGAHALKAPIAEAMSFCSCVEGQSQSAVSKQITKLLDLRTKLINSSEDEDLLKVATINRKIKKLQGDNWGRICRIIEGNLKMIFQNKLPKDLDHMVASLQPNSKFSGVLENLSNLCVCLTGQCRDILNKSLSQIDDKAKTEHAKANAEISQLEEELKGIATDIEKFDYDIEQIESQLEGLQSQLQECQTRWSELWPNTYSDLNATEAAPNLDSISLEHRQESFNNWLSRSTNSRQRNNKWRSIQQEWIRRLEKPQTAENKALNNLYVSNANVVGLTCLESGQRSFYGSDDFEPFDVVIVDEVSKATPAELLMPMMLGRKVILVGDHRQLPPMFKERESSFAEAVEDGQIKAEDFERFRSLVTASFFEEMFEKADDSIRQSIFEHYRSHGQIMALFNLFYSNRLNLAGGDRANNSLRQHHLAIKDRNGGWFLEPDNHVLWIDSTKQANGKLFIERQAGSSKINLLEVDLVIASIMRLNWGLRNRGYDPCKTAKAKSSQNHLLLQNWVRLLLPSAKNETIADLFARRQVRIDGHVEPTDYVIKTGDTIQIDARMPIGIITFYGAQLGQIRSKITQLNAKDSCYLDACNLHTNTVDRFQGKEMPIVIVSLVRAPQHQHIGQFAKEYRRINVALSRAQNLLIIIGSERSFRNVAVEIPNIEDNTVRKIPVYRKIFDLVTQIGGRRYARDLLKW